MNASKKSDVRKWSAIGSTGRRSGREPENTALCNVALNYNFEQATRVRDQSPQLEADMKNPAVIHPQGDWGRLGAKTALVSARNPTCVPEGKMRITGVTTHIIEYDLREAWGDRPGPEDLPNTSYPIPLVTIHTDEGIDGHTM